MAQSSDEIIKREIIEKLGYKKDNIILRIFPEGSNDDQKLITDGGLTFTHNGLDYGSCDAGWFIEEVDKEDIPIIALEGTDALNRGSSGNAQYQRFHHALGAVKNGVIGIYYLRKGNDEIQPDLYGMAYNASMIEKGYYLIIDDLRIVENILNLYNDKLKLKTYLDDYLNLMKSIFDKSFNEKYEGDWNKFAKKRSTIITNDYVIKHAARMVRNFTDSSQRAGHIAVGEMFLTKYYFPNKTFYYLFPKMTRKDIDFLDKTKSHDKEWALLRNEPNVRIITMDDIVGLPSKIKKELLKIKDKPSKGDTLRTYNKISKLIMEKLKNKEYKIK